MSKNNIIERGDAKIEAVAGAIQKAVGHVIGNEEMEAKGAAHKAVGAARGEAARKAEHVKGVVEEVTGSAKAKVGDLLDDSRMEFDGKVRELTGKARQATSKS